MKKTLPFLWRYLAVVTVSCLLAFVISQSRVEANTAATSTANTAAITEAKPSVAGENLANPYAMAGPYEVVSSDAVWRDKARDRDIPVHIFAPKSVADGANTKLPVILFSHGLGGSREGGALWGQHWASHGYIVLHLQHAGSDNAIWKDKEPSARLLAMKSNMNLQNNQLRIDDVHFAIDEITRLSQSKTAPWGSADLLRIGMSGHSYGSQTTLAISGQLSPMPGLKSARPARDDRIKASIAFSPNARVKIALDKQFGSINIPFFSVTGTKDGSVLDDKTAADDRLIPYQKMPAGEKYLAVFEGGDHMVFNGHALEGRRPETPRDREIQKDVKAATLAFWNSTLKQDAAAKNWLASQAGDGFKSMLLAGDVFEHK